MPPPLHGSPLRGGAVTASAVTEGGIPTAPPSAPFGGTSPARGEAFRGARRLGAPCSCACRGRQAPLRKYALCRARRPGAPCHTARSLPPSFASQMPPPSSEGGFLRGCSLWLPLTRTDSPCQGADSPYQGEMSRSDRGDREMAKGGRDAVERSETGGKIAPVSL